MTDQYGITLAQYEVLMRPLRGTRISTRRQGGKDLSYVQTWDIKAHLTRIFGFGNWDSEILDYRHVVTREYAKDGKDMVEVSYSARVQLTIRTENGARLCVHTEAAVGSTSGPAYLLGDHHDNSLKTAASDALKRCAINLGSQFGLGLYNNGTLADVVRETVVKPAGYVDAPTAVTPEQEAMLAQSLGATEVTK